MTALTNNPFYIPNEYNDKDQEEVVLVTSLSSTNTRSPPRQHPEGITTVGHKAPSNLLDLPTDSLCDGILSCLSAKDLVSLGETCRAAYAQSREGLWKTLCQRDFQNSSTSAAKPVNLEQSLMAYKLKATGMDIHNRCFMTNRTFVECILGVGLDYTVNPRTKTVDYISVSQSLVSMDTFATCRRDTFGNEFKLFFPLYFSKEHFQRALSTIKKVLIQLCPDRQTSARGRFEASMILDVFPKMINSFVVLLSDKGVAASHNTFQAFTRVHRLFLAMAEQYPSIRNEATRRLWAFIKNEKKRWKKAWPSLGWVLPLLMIVDHTDCNWVHIRASYLTESFDRSVLWICKEYPHLEKTPLNPTPEQQAERVHLSRQAMAVSLRLVMFHAFFLRAACQGSSADRSRKYDLQVFWNNRKQDPSSHHDTGLSSQEFCKVINQIVGIHSFQGAFRFLGLEPPATKQAMAQLLCQRVESSRQKRYHRPGMDFDRVQRNGTSRLLSKGQKFSTSSQLRRVVFTDTWKFEGETKFLDATCLVYAGKQRLQTIDYQSRVGQNRAIVHSGDVMSTNGGNHTINIDLSQLNPDVSSLIFVISAWDNARLRDIQQPQVHFRDADTDTPLCQYDLGTHDKVDSLTSVIMCKLFCEHGRWHVLAIGDSHGGDASNYRPIYTAAVTHANPLSERERREAQERREKRERRAREQREQEARVREERSAVFWEERAQALRQRRAAELEQQARVLAERRDETGFILFDLLEQD